MLSRIHHKMKIHNISSPWRLQKTGKKAQEDRKEHPDAHGKRKKRRVEVTKTDGYPETAGPDDAPTGSSSGDGPKHIDIVI